MHLIRLAPIALIAAAASVAAQGPTTSTAGVPVSQNVGDGGTSTAYAPGQGGTSTGTSINFQSGSLAGAPSSSVISTTLTGEAAAQASASLSVQAAEASGSNGMYTTTTGGAIAGISSGLPGGYNEMGTTVTGSTDQSTSAAGSSSSGGGDAAGPSLFQLDGTAKWMMASTAALLGALVFL